MHDGGSGQSAGHLHQHVWSHFTGRLVCLYAEDGRPIWLDASNRFAPLGVLAPNREGGAALVLGPNGGAFHRLPAQDPARNAYTRTLSLTVDRPRN